MIDEVKDNLPELLNHITTLKNHLGINKKENICAKAK